MDIPPFLTQERKHTDESLNVERGKTDDSLMSLRRKVQREADATVRKDRSRADRNRDKDRVDVDSTHHQDDVLTDQRLTSDANMRSERRQVDAAIKAERTKQDRVLLEFLRHEREDTDGNLLIERDQSDIAARLSDARLNEEMSSHTKTRTELMTRDELFAIVSHDLRNPIGTVLSCADLLLDGPMANDVDPQAKHWIDMIKRNAQTSLRLISDLLDTERIAQGKLCIEPTENDLNAVIADVRQSLAYLAESKQIELTTRIPAGELRLNFDRDRIFQVLSNLVGNALKFTPEGGVVTVAIEPSPKRTVVSVTDTGPGVPEDRREEIFVRYAQIGRKDRSGLGLGLYIAKMLVEAHGGTLSVSSAEPGGSRFSFDLPS